MALRIGSKTLGPKGLVRSGVEDFVLGHVHGQAQATAILRRGHATRRHRRGRLHELVRRGSAPEGELIDGRGKVLAMFPGTVACASKLLHRPGEQLLTYTRDGTVRIWPNENASDDDRARRRYAHAYYRTNQRLTATGSNAINLGGL